MEKSLIIYVKGMLENSALNILYIVWDEAQKKPIEHVE